MENCQYGVLMELKAVGQADQHFIGNPQHSVFKKQFKQHANHAIDWNVRSHFEGQGTRYHAEIKAKGDMCIGAMIDLGKANALSNINSFTVKIGGLVIQEGEVASAGNLSFLDNGNHFFTIRENLNKRNVIKNNYNISLGTTTYTKQYHILDTFFSKKGCGLLLPKDQLQKIEIEIEFEEAPDDDAHMYLQTFQVYFDDPQSMDVPHDIPILQLQRLSHPKESSKTTKVKLNYNLPIRALFMQGGIHYKMKINGQTRFDLSQEQLRLISIFVDGPHNKDNISDGTVSPYYFGIPHEDGYSGSFNMSKVDTVELVVTSKTYTLGDTIEIVAENYNLLRYRNGKYSLMYTD